MAWHEEDDQRSDATAEGDDCDQEDCDEAEEDKQADLMPCPHGGHEVCEEAQFCPWCEQYLSEEGLPPSRKPWWMILGGLTAKGAA